MKDEPVREAQEGAQAPPREDTRPWGMLEMGRLFLFATVGLVGLWWVMVGNTSPISLSRLYRNIVGTEEMVGNLNMTFLVIVSVTLALGIVLMVVGAWRRKGSPGHTPRS